MPTTRTPEAPPAPPVPVDESQLDELLSRPRAQTIAALEACDGDVVVLGAGGKMGPTLTTLVARAAAVADQRAGRKARRVVAVSRFSSASARRALEDAGVETVACDLLDRAAVARLPGAPNVLFMAGQKFGTADAPAVTWAMNTIVPSICAERYAGARIVAFSTGNVYPLTPVARGGARESDALGPVGEYAASCVGRERIFELAADRDHTRVALLRLNYASDLRYGVLTDLAVKVLRAEPIDLRMGHVNVIWQGDANRIAVECLPLATAPPFVVNVTGRAVLSVRELATRLGERLERSPVFAGEEAADALLSDTTRMASAFAPPEMPLDWMVACVADWVRDGR
ncbi:MAG: NAD-dependent epimerase/dehydratase family protein, partial [Gemmatimonadota bacterium]|nr:NAD-dependent epimerase/dehydratase family protein [Gemmatimonadota bacterium]